MVTAWAFGACINVVGSILINLGTNVMKLGHNRRAAHEGAIKPSIRHFKPWQLGVLLFGVGNVLNFFSFGFAAQSLLSALGSIQFVSNVFFASAVLGEQVTQNVIFATLCIVAGCVLLVSCGNHESQTLTVSDMISFYESPVYVSFLVLLVLATGCFFFAYHYGQQKLAWMGRDALDDKWVKSLPVTYALFSGTIGTQSVLFCKTLSTLLRTTLAGDSQLQSYFFWMTFLSFVATAYFWITRLNQGLQLFPAIVIVPMMQISWTMFSILSGGIYFQEYVDLSVLRGFGYGLGVAVVFVGVYLLTPTNKPVGVGRDLESGLVDSNGDSGGHMPPLIDIPHIPNLHSRNASDLQFQDEHEASSPTSSSNSFSTLASAWQESTILLGNPGFKALSTSSYFGSTKVQRAPQSTTQNSSTAEAMHEPLMQTSKIPVRLVIGEDSNQIPAWHPEDSDRTLHCRENLGRLSSFGELKDVSRRLSGRSCTESCSRVN